MQEQRTLTVKTQAVAKRSMLRVGVKTRVDDGQWRFIIQKKVGKDRWKKIKRVVVVKGKTRTRTPIAKLRISGSGHKSMVDLARGTYRVKVQSGHGFAGATGKPVTLRR